MSWPEDNVDFDAHELLDEQGGDALSAAELAAIYEKTKKPFPPEAGRDFSKRKKAYCGGEPEKIKKIVGPGPDSGIAEIRMESKSAVDAREIAAQLDLLHGRQDKLAEATLKSLERISRRMDRIEARPVPLLSLSAWQKGCLFIFLLCMSGITALFVMSAIIHANGWAK